MSDFLQLVDEVIDGTPEYTLTQKPNGKYDIELANEVLQQGTALNKANHNIFNNILGYNECEVENIQVQQEIENLNSQVYCEHSTYDRIPAGTGNYTYGYLQVEQSTQQNSIKTDPTFNRPNNYIAIDSGPGFSNGIMLYNYTSGASHIKFLLDNVEQIKQITFSIGSVSPTTSTYAILKLLDENNVLINETRLNMTSSGASQNINFEDYENIKVIDIYWYLGNSKNNNLQIYFKNIKKQISFQRNLFYSTNIPNNFINNQVVNISTGNVLESFDNYFNNIAIDTLLQNNKYYELLYDEPNNRFIAEEVRA